MPRIRSKEFFKRDCLDVAPDLVGKILCRRTDDGVVRLRISETEAYRGEEDTACHAHKGQTPRTEVLYRDGGTVYVYLCYGIHWLLNIITGDIDQSQGVLIRACVDAEGPGKLTKKLGVTGGLNRQSILESEELWIEDDGEKFDIITAERVGIGYASPEDQAKPWRYILKKNI